MSTSACLNCGMTERDRPLLTIKFQSRELYICPQCLPVLIHKPYQLGEKLPGIKSYENPPERDD